MPKKGMVFGVFDGLHEGHKHFLSEATKNCNELVVAVTPSETVLKLKGRAPKRDFKERAGTVAAFNPRFFVVSGDTTLGAWGVLEEHQPDMVFLGYDQDGIAEELKKKGVSFATLPSHFPERYKSGLLNS